MVMRRALTFYLLWSRGDWHYCRVLTFQLTFHFIFFLPKYVDDLFFFLQKNEAFTNALSSYVQDGFPVAICTGTTAWSNLAGNPDVAVNNSLAACKSINKCSGIGLINAQVSNTMWKLQNFSVTHILCEINFGNPRSEILAILAHFETLNFDCLWILALFEGWNLPNQQNSKPPKICIKKIKQF